MKNLLLTAVLFLLFGFVSNLSAQQVLGGTFEANSSVSGFTLDKNSGDRFYSTYVSFEKGFDTMPTIMLTVTKLEAGKDTNLRYQVSAEAVSRDGFTIKIKTWSDTKIYNIGGNWAAIAAN